LFILTLPSLAPKALGAATPIGSTDSTLWLLTSKKVEIAGEAAKVHGNFPEELPFTARKLAENDSGIQSGENFKHFTLLTPGWKLAVHVGLLRVVG
jgi:hypothetical protein